MIIIIAPIFLVFLIMWICIHIRNYQRRIKQHTTDLPRSFLLPEYEFKSHKLTTEDGYFVQLFNIRHKEKYNQRLKPVLFQHGLNSSGVMWFTTPDGSSPVTIAADLG